MTRPYIAIANIVSSAPKTLSRRGFESKYPQQYNNTSAPTPKMISPNNPEYASNLNSIFRCIPGIHGYDAWISPPFLNVPFANWYTSQTNPAPGTSANAPNAGRPNVRSKTGAAAVAAVSARSRVITVSQPSQVSCPAGVFGCVGSCSSAAREPTARRRKNTLPTWENYVKPNQKGASSLARPTFAVYLFSSIRGCSARVCIPVLVSATLAVDPLRPRRHRRSD